MPIFTQRPGWGLIVAILIVGAPIYFGAKYLIQAPWGKLDINEEIERQLHVVASKNLALPKIVLGRRLADDGHLTSSWYGSFDYEATVEGRATKVRISWKEIQGLNVVTRIEELVEDSAPKLIWGQRDPRASGILVEFLYAAAV